MAAFEQFCVVTLIMLLGVASTAGAVEVRVTLRHQTKEENEDGPAGWRTVTTVTTLRAEETAIIICDMWDKHWSRGATERVAAMAPRMNEVVKAARSRGITIIHAPSETMDFYENTPARKRMIEAPHADMPRLSPRIDLPLPIDDSDGGSDTGEKPWYKAWSRQHPAIEIDQAKDGISDDGQEVWNFMRMKGIRNLIIMGVHTNMCVLNRPFAIRAMVRRGVNVILVRDLTDAMYNPAMPPHVSHEKGTRLVIDYIEKNYCPTMLGEEFVKGLK
jgi:nicotinamidase-related amidase